MDQKIENQLNLAINIPEDERVRTQDLDTGYNMTENEWELIVKYNGNIETAAMLQTVLKYCSEDTHL